MLFLFLFGLDFILFSLFMMISLMQSQETTSKVVVKVLKMQVLRAQGKKIKNELNMLIRVLEESRHIWDVL